MSQSENPPTSPQELQKAHQKLKARTPEGTQLLIDALQQWLPSCVTESVNDKGQAHKGVDFDALRQELAGEILEGPQERYHLNWPGKKKALLEANVGVTHTLRPQKTASLNFDNTRNVFIEGDNLKALKLLQPSLLGQVKMIYIDPPYNTGKDFIYKDRFASSCDEWGEESGQKNGDSERLVANLEGGGRFHSNWCSMIYSRLKVARHLLRDDGVICISIDDNEVHNLRKICDEVFGASNFVAQIVVQNNPQGRNYGGVALTHEYVVVYSRRQDVELNLIHAEGKKMPYTDAHGVFELQELRNRNVKFNETNRPNLCYPIYVHPNTEDENGLCNISLQPLDGAIKTMPLKSRGIQTVWRWSKDRVLKNLNVDVKSKKKNDGNFMIVKKSRSLLKRERSIWSETDIRTECGTLSLKQVFEEHTSPFDYPKSPNLIKRLVNLGSGKNDIILDFFAGSGTTAHAVMQLNAEDGGRRRVISIQLDEKCDKNSAAFKAGYKTIADIARERIRRAGQKINDELLVKAQKGSPQSDMTNLLAKDDMTPPPPHTHTGAGTHHIYGGQSSTKCCNGRGPRCWISQF